MPRSSGDHYVPGNDVYRFGGSTYRPGRRTRSPEPPPPPPLHLRPRSPAQQYRLHRSRSCSPKGHNDFTFRAKGPSFPRDAPRGPRTPRQNKGRGHSQGSRGRGGKMWQPYKASNRALLQADGATTPERLSGMADGPSRFKRPEDLSESEGEMEMGSDYEDGNENSDQDHDDGPARKRTRTQPDGNSMPKWSNPDPYTVLPLPDESKTKKKDVVNLIRKAKVAAAQQNAKKNVHANALAANDDFISFDAGQDSAESSENGSFTETMLHAGPQGGLAARPSPPFSHLDNLYPNRIAPPPPGQNAAPVPARALAPPPSFTTSYEADPSQQVVKVQQPPKPQLPPKSKHPLQQPFYHVVENDTWPPPTTSSAMGALAPTPVPLYGKTAVPMQLKSGFKKRKRNTVVNGLVTEEWLPVSVSHATPWCVVDHSETRRVSLWLHKEICDFYDYVRPREFEFHVRNDVITRIQKFVDRRFHEKAEVKSFGSFAAGLHLPTADMDLVLLSASYKSRGQPHFTGSKILWMFKQFLEEDNFAQPGSIEVITKAKVPLVKFLDRVSGLKVDLSFENSTGPIANATFQNWKAQYPAMPMLVTAVKHFLLMRNMNEVFLGGIGGFTVICLVVSMLQHMPAVQAGNLPPTYNLGELLLHFFDLYGNRFNLVSTGISLDPPCYFPKNPKAQKNPDRLCIIDPNRRENDISNGSHKIGFVIKAFSDAHAAIVRQMALLDSLTPAQRRGSSILGAVFAGDYSSFESQRRHLRRVHDGSFSSNARSEITGLGLAHLELADVFDNFLAVNKFEWTDVGPAEESVSDENIYWTIRRSDI